MTTRSPYSTRAPVRRAKSPWWRTRSAAAERRSLQRAKNVPGPLPRSRTT
ncbi:hypothetical protein [Streptomyces sp. NPDC096105]